jgi:hypothetical protein
MAEGIMESKYRAKLESGMVTYCAFVAPIPKLSKAKSKKYHFFIL